MPKVITDNHKKKMRMLFKIFKDAELVAELMNISKDCVKSNVEDSPSTKINYDFIRPELEEFATLTSFRKARADKTSANITKAQELAFGSDKQRESYSNEVIEEIENELQD